MGVKHRDDAADKLALASGQQTPRTTDHVIALG
jgi:hypothetical protein